MGQEVFGPFSARDEAVNLVNSLELKGYSAQNITVFTHRNDTSDMKKHTDVNVESNVTEEKREESFTDKVKKIFFNDNTEDTDSDIYDKLMDLGMSDQQASKYIEEIESGKILVIADDTLKMGHDPTSTSDTGVLEEAAIQRNK
ncbi:general stress protein [Virgibacillus ainsalahensis]